MKKLIKLSQKEILHRIMESKRLREKFNSYIDDCEMNWLGEKVACFHKYRGAADWSLGAYNQSYLHVKDASAFLYAVEECIESYGCTENLRKQVEKCAKLRGCNLFEWNVTQMAQVFYEEELMHIEKHIEDCGYDIHCQNETDRLLDYVEMFSEHYLDDIYIDSQNRLVRLDYISA